MWKKLVAWIASVFWPLIRDEVMPMVWKFVKKHADEMLAWLWRLIKERFEESAEETKRHAREQEEHAKSKAEDTQDSNLADHWKQAAEYWRGQYERAEQLLQQNLSCISEDFAKASRDFHGTMDAAAVEMEFEAGSIRASLGSEQRMLELPKDK